MKRNDEELKQAAILQFLAGATDKEVSTELGVSVLTVWRWRVHDAAFASALERGRAPAVARACARAAAAADRAIDALVDALEARSEMARVMAAKAILERVIPQKVETTPERAAFEKMAPEEQARQIAKIVQEAAKLPGVAEALAEVARNGSAELAEVEPAKGGEDAG